MEGFDLAGFRGQPQRLGRDLQELCGVAEVEPGFDPVIGGVRTENLIRVDEVMESPKLVE